jgi:hypothetical protein
MVDNIVTMKKFKIQALRTMLSSKKKVSWLMVITNTGF